MVPFTLLEATSIDRIGVAFGGTNGRARLGIYATGADGFPETLLVDAGTVPAAGYDYGLVTVDVTLQAGIYWIAQTASSDANMPGSDASMSGSELAIAHVGATPDINDLGGMNYFYDTSVYNDGSASSALPATLPKPIRSNSSSYPYVLRRNPADTGGYNMLAN